MRSVHFRVSDGMYVLIQQGAEDVGASVANFCREAAIARAVLWEARRGHDWTDREIWEPIMRQVERIERHDTKLRAEAARRRRLEAPPRRGRPTPGRPRIRAPHPGARQRAAGGQPRQRVPGPAKRLRQAGSRVPARAAPTTARTARTTTAGCPSSLCTKWSL
jgi:uncharacterized protein (DUF1778 family)